MKLSLTLIMSLTLATSMAMAQTKKRIDVSKDVDTLGGNRNLIEMAQAIDPENRSRIVQSRLVDRYNRFELGLSYSGVAGGDSYVTTQSLGAALDFHFTPRWSVGLRYNDYGNSLTPEGKRVFDEARADYAAGNTSRIPDIDVPQQSAMAVINWYPMYGKTNLLDRGIAQFDMYLLAGGGQIELNSGWTTVMTAGGGVGIWMTQHFSARGEIRYQNYQDQIITGSRQIHGVVGTLGIGLML